MVRIHPVPQTKNSLYAKSTNVGTRHQRKLRRFKKNFNTIFNFFLKSNRSGILDFCGVEVIVEGNPDGPCGREGFRLYDDGEFRNGKMIVSRHSNILKSVIVGKKSWGLWIDQWSDGIVECCFTLEEILNQFEDKGIEIPEPLLKDFENRIWKKKLKRNEQELKRLNLGN